MRATGILRISVLLVAVVGWIAAFGPTAAGQTRDLAEFLAAPEDHAGETVALEGELIGDYGFRRNGFMWTQLNDDAYTRRPLVESGFLGGSNVGIGIRMPHALAAGLDPPGGYRQRGPVVVVTGVFRYHDPDRQGETYIDVVALRVVEPGRRLAEGPNPITLGVGVVLITGAAVVLWGYRRR